MPKFDSYYRSDIGKVRTNNEDFCGSIEPTDRRVLEQSGRLYVIADGMGGHEQGEKASTYAVQTLLNLYYRSSQVPPHKRLRESILQINQSLVAYTKENLQPGEKTGTTLVAAVVRKGRMWVANVGDSRLYLIRDGRIQQITRDHSLVAEMVRAGTISEEEARQSKYRNRLSRSVGIDPKLEVDIHPEIQLRSGDIILLCTDGVTQYASSKDILSATYGSAKEIAERLISIANERGGSDNITVSVIRYEKEPGFPMSLPLRQLLVLGIGIVLLLAFVLLAWVGLFWWTGLPASPTLTPSVVLASSPLPFNISTPTSVLSVTEIIPSPADPTLQAPSMVPPAPSVINGLVDCEYIVAAGDNTTGIALLFGVILDQIYRQDGTQENMNSIRTGEILVIKGISTESCAGSGGVVQAGQSITP